jgi:RND family efflux transporter MFP subunit
MKTTKLTLLIFAAWIAQACTHSAGKNNFSEDLNKIPVRIQRLQAEERSLQIHTSGQFTTNDETFLSFKTSGIVDRIFVREGDAVRKGQLLAKLNLTEINAQLAQAESVLEKAKRDYGRVFNLHKDSVATIEQFQNSKTALDVATKQMEAVKFNQSYSEIRALSNGHILHKFVSEGQMIAAGSPALQINSGEEGDWVLKAGISDLEWASIKLGDQAELFIDALPRDTFAATVVRKSHGVDLNTGSFTIELRLAGKLPSVIASGLFGKAVITPSAKQKVWSIPYSALLDGDSQSGFVFVTNDMKTAKKQQVKISSIGNDFVLISTGLENARSIIISGSAYVSDNSPILILEQTDSRSN